MSKKTYTGFNKDTTENLMLDAGAIFANFDIEEDTFETAKEKLLGATSGGNTFTATPEFRQIEVDGVKGKAKGLSILQSWEVLMQTNMLEFKEDTFKHSLAAIETAEKTINEMEYTEIKGKNYIEDEDYIDNITYIGNLSGSNNPVIIQVFNALSLEGLEVEFVDDDDIVAELTFEGHYSVDKLDNPPFAIYYPRPIIELP